MTSLIVGISGSLGPNARTTSLVEFGLELVEARGFRPKLIDLQAENLEWCDGRDPATYLGATADAIGTVQDCAGCIVGSPAYRAAYSGRLKNFLDILPPEALKAKPVCLVGTGGSSEHSLFVDYALRPVLAQFGCVVSGTSVYATPQDFAPDGLAPSARERMEEAVDDLCRLVGPPDEQQAL